MTDSRVLIIGGGVAGSVCALQLRQHGIEVTVAEKASFPRRKVCGCCIGGSGVAVLKSLGVTPWLRQHGQPLHRWQGSLGGRVIDLSLPDGYAISREALDTELLNRAQDSGVDVHRECRAHIDAVDQNSVRATLTRGSTSKTDDFSVVVVATGLNSGGAGKMLPWQTAPHGPFGIAFTAQCDSAQPGVIYMACDDDGYVGLVRLEDNRVDVAAALNSGSDAASVGLPEQRVARILDRSEFGFTKMTDESSVLTTPPLRRQRAVGNGRVIAIGDAAGYVEPFTGEGMTWAMKSGIAAAELIADSTVGSDQLGSRWQTRHRSLLRTDMIACRVVTGALRSPTARTAIANALHRWPSLASPLTKHLNR